MNSYVRVGFCGALGGALSGLLGGLAAQSAAIAQISADGSLGTQVNGSETQACGLALCTISGGTLNRQGSLLLHSLKDFSLPGEIPDQTALFLDPGVRDIVVRVTGGEVSALNGTLRISPLAPNAVSTASLFVINPSGIQFGPGARLDLGGDFVASSADQVLFDGGVSWPTGEASAPSQALLTVSAPIGLGFLSAGQPIAVEGSGHFLTLGGAAESPASQFVNRSFQQLLAAQASPIGPATLPEGLPPTEPSAGPPAGPPAGPFPQPPAGPSAAGPLGPLPRLSELAVRPGRTLALIASGLDLTGANLTAAGGQLELASVAAGEVRFEPGADGRSVATSAFDYSQIDRFADISLLGRSLLEASAPIPGQIFLRGQRILLDESAAALAETLPTGVSPPGVSQDLLPRANSLAAELGGRIDIQATDELRISDFSGSFPENFSAGEPGFAEPLGAPPFHSYLSVDVAPGAPEDGGVITVRSPRLSLDNGAQFGANTFGLGHAGQIVLEVEDTLALVGGGAFGPSGLFAVADPLGGGDGGEVAIAAGHLLMEQGSQVSTTSLSQGRSGQIAIQADRVSLLGTSPPIALPPELSPDLSAPDSSGQLGPTVVSPTTLQSSMGERSQGQGGDVVINARQVRVAEGAEVATGTSGLGNAGALKVTAEEITVSGVSPLEGPSGFFTTVGASATGQGGLLQIEADRLAVSGGAQIATSTAGLGGAGDLQVTGRESVAISDQTPEGRSGLFATAIVGSGPGGNLLVETNNLQVRDGGAVSVSNFPSGTGSPFPPGRGAAGNLQVRASQIVLSNQALLSADTAAGDRGNISIETQVLTLRQGSRITTNATETATGGNIAVAAPAGFVVAVPTENSDITANAVFGAGGRVSIRAQNVLGIEARPALTPLSDITASSEFGVAGETKLETLDTEVRPQDNPLPQSTETPTISQGCNPASGRSTSRFVQSGRGGLGASPYGILDSRDSLADVSLPPAWAEAGASESGTAPPPQSQAHREDPIEEAQGWEINAQGEVMLVAAAEHGKSRCL